MTIHVYSPVPTDDGTEMALAPRPRSLEGARMGYLGNLKANCDVLLRTTQTLISREFAVPEGIFREKASCSIGAPVDMLEEIRTSCTHAVVALGD